MPILTRDRAAYLVLCAIWGTTWLAIRVAVRDFPPLLSAAGRFVIAAIVLLLLARLRAKRSAFTASERRAVMLLSVLMFALPYGLVFWGEQYVTSGVTAILFAAYPVLVLTFSSLLQKQNLFNPVRVASLVLCIAGIVIIFSDRLYGNPGLWRGQLAIVGASASSAAAVVYAKRNAYHLDVIGSTGWQMAGGALLLLVSGMLLERNAIWHFSWTASAALLYLAVAGSCLTFVLYYSLLKRLSALKMSMIALVTPVVAVFVGWVVLDEQITLRTTLGAACVLSGVITILREGPAAEVAGVEP